MKKLISAGWPILGSMGSAAITIATLRYAWVEKMMTATQEKPPLGRVP